jgi:hypothetical protein
MMEDLVVSPVVAKDTKANSKIFSRVYEAWSWIVMLLNKAGRLGVDVQYICECGSIQTFRR